MSGGGLCPSFRSCYLPVAIDSSGARASLVSHRSFSYQHGYGESEHRLRQLYDGDTRNNIYVCVYFSIFFLYLSKIAEYSVPE